MHRFLVGMVRVSEGVRGAVAVHPEMFPQDLAEAMLGRGVAGRLAAKMQGHVRKEATLSRIP